jgi:DNA repair exonuclease SbcCD nuclease subunit
MKIFHLADTHLGYSAYRKTTEEGINQRENDIYQAFTQCIDYALTHKPDLILHAGDLFDSVRPTNRALTIALQQIMRLSKNQIPFIIISGNHETPRLRETGHIFRIFDHLDHVYPIYQEKYETIPLQIDGKNIIIHAIPQCPTKNHFEENLKKITIDSSADYNLFMAHGAVTGITEFRMNEFNELLIPTKALSNDFDYIALGHYHTYTKLMENTFYSGSPERFSFAEANEKKGMIESELTPVLKTTFIEIKTRPMIDTLPINCSELTPEQIMNRINDTITTLQPEKKILRIILDKIPYPIYRSLDFQDIRELTKGSLHCELKINTIKEGQTQMEENNKIESLSEEFIKYLNQQQHLAEKENLRKLGLKYIQQIESQDEEK